MTSTPELRRNWTALLTAQTERCAKCGKCRAVCPVFMETGDERLVARGRLALMDARVARQVDRSPLYLDSIRTCLKCLRCIETCPSGVETDVAIQSARFLLAEEKPLPFPTRLVLRFLLPRRFLFDPLLRVAYRAQFLFPGNRDGKVRHLPLFFMSRRWLPELAPRTALQEFGVDTSNAALDSAAPNIDLGAGVSSPVQGMPFSEKINPHAKTRRVGLFVGCMINYVYPQVARSAIRLLEGLGYSVVVPSQQVCCGSPALSVGDRVAAETLARRNLQAFREAGLSDILTACATCGSAIKHEYPRMFGSEGQEFADKITDITGFLDRAGIETRLAKSPVRVTYHDPCHLRSGQGVSEEPRSLLRAACDYQEMENASACCGFGGSFSFGYSDLSSKIAQHKVEAIRNSNAEVVATACPGCMLQLTERLASEGILKPVRHVVELL